MDTVNCNIKEEYCINIILSGRCPEIEPQLGDSCIGTSSLRPRIAEYTLDFTIRENYMESIVYNDETYYICNGVIYDSSYIAIPRDDAKPILEKYYGEMDFDNMYYDDYVKVLNGLKSSGNYQKCVELIYKGFELFDETSYFRCALPILTSCYRLMNEPQKAIDFWEKVRNVYYAYRSTALYTSLGAAYCDINDIEMARKCANIANAIRYQGNSDQEELKYLYARIKRMSK